jgi:phosphatidylinositol alpha-mannosyltransferase
LGHDVIVLAPADADETAGGVAVIGRPTGVRANGSVAPVALSPAAAVRAERLVRRGTFDLVHLHEPTAPVAGYGILLAGRVPIVGTFHRSGTDAAMRLARPVLSVLCRRIRIRTAVSAAARDTAARACGGSYEVLFNGVELERFTSARPCEDPRGRPAVVFVGRHEPRKGLEVLLDAFTRVPDPAVLWVIGDGPATETARRHHPESERVRWLGRLGDQEVSERLVGAAVLCAPSLGGESFGVVLLEGMAAGCAVVASDIEGYRAAAGGHAALVQPGDPTGLAGALERALADARAGRGLSAPEARRAAVEHAASWSMDSLAERYTEVYERALSPVGTS